MAEFTPQQLDELRLNRMIDDMIARDRARYEHREWLLKASNKMPEVKPDKPKSKCGSKPKVKRGPYKKYIRTAPSPTKLGTSKYYKKELLT